MITTSAFKQLFPFGICLDDDLRIVHLGRTLEKRLKAVPLNHFQEVFELFRLQGPVDANLLNLIAGRPVQFKERNSSLVLVGAFSVIENGFLFLGTPKLESVTDLAPLGLQINDFSAHDGVMNSLFQLQKVEVAAKESIESAQNLSNQQQVYRQIVEQSNDLIFAINSKGCVSVVNPSASALLGIQVDKTDASEFLSFENKRIWDAAALSLKGGASSAWVELALQGIHGDEVLAEGHLVLSVATEDEESVLCFLRDVSARRKAERDLLASDEKLRQAQKMEAVGRLAGGIAHDFNNLLGVISGAASLIQSDLDVVDERYSDIGLILSTAEQGAALARQILQFSRRSPAAKGQTELVSQTDSLFRLLRNVVGVNVEIMIDSKIDSIVVDIAPIQYEQILLNLAVNAGYAMPEGGTLEIELSQSADPGYGCFKVKDSGFGMEPHVLQRIFEPFFTTKPLNTGSGLGLSVVYGIVEEAQGEISASSEPGVGTIFTVTLPISQEKKTEGVSHSASLLKVKRVKGSGRAIVLEDLPELGRLTTRALERLGLQVECFESLSMARAGFAAFEGVPDIFITDVALPDGNGLDLVEELASGDRVRNVIITTGNADFDRINSLISKYGWKILMKPFRIQQLQELVESFLNEEVAP